MGVAPVLRLSAGGLVWIGGRVPEVGTPPVGSVTALAAAEAFRTL
jgi:hypothetical protein